MVLDSRGILSFLGEIKISAIVQMKHAKEKPQQGEVVAVGSGKLLEDGGKRVPLEVKKGDKVLFGKYSGTEIKIEGTEYLMMREEDILGVIER